MTADERRHPSLVRITAALEDIWAAQAAASSPSPMLDVPPAFVWAHADVGRKDMSADGSRWLMPLRTDAARYVTDAAPIVLNARLGSTSLTRVYTPRLHRIDMRLAHERSDAAREVLWKHIRIAIHKKVARFLSSLAIEYHDLHHTEATLRTGVDDLALEEVVSAIELGSHEPALDSLALHTMTMLVARADLSRVDAQRWIEAFVSGRCEFAVRRILDDPREGSRIRRAVMSDACLDDFRPRDVTRALALDVSPLLARGAHAA